MKKLIPSVAILVYLFYISGTATAQIKGVKEGDQIRITAPSVSDNKITGIILNISKSMIRISNENYQYPELKWIDIPLESIDQLEVRKTVRKTGRGALVGAGIGGVTLGILTMASNEPCEPDEWCFIEFSDGEAFLMGAALGGLAGALTGAIVGSTIKTVGWKQVPFTITAGSISLNYFKQVPTPGITLKWSF